MASPEVRGSRNSPIARPWVRKLLTWSLVLQYSIFHRALRCSLRAGLGATKGPWGPKVKAVTKLLDGS